MKQSLTAILLFCFMGCVKDYNDRIEGNNNNNKDLMSKKVINATACNPISAIHVSGTSTSATVSWLGAGTSVTLTLHSTSGWPKTSTTTGSS